MVKNKSLSVTEKNLDLTVKQAKFLKLYLKTGNGSEAAMRSYNCKDRAVAGAIASENLQKLKEPIKMMMEERGLSLGRLLEVLSEGLEAKKITGTKDDFVETEDFGVRHKYMESMAKWLGVEQTAPATPPQINTQTFNFFSISTEKRQAFNADFKKFLSGFYGKEEKILTPKAQEDEGAE